MYSKKLFIYTLLFFMMFTFYGPVSVTNAASPVNDILGTLAAPTSDLGNGGLLSQLFSLLFDKILGPILNIFGGKGASDNPNLPPIKLPENTPSVPPLSSGVGILSGKIIVVDPGHGGDNPGATGNGTREADNNLAVGLKLRNLLVKAGAKVVMTRETDKNVAPPGSSLSTELQARVDIAEANNADIFVSIHTNENSNSGMTGVTTYYPRNGSSELAREIQKTVVNETNETDRGTLAEGFYVLRNTSMPSTLVEMGFISNPGEAALLADDNHRNKIAKGIFNGIVQYLEK